MLPLVVVVESNDGLVRRYAFAGSPVSIGRNPFAELQLTEPFISRWEGTLRFDESEVTYFSLGATNQAYVDGRPLQSGEDVVLRADSVLSIGTLILHCSREFVPEADLRRKGKPRPASDQPDTALKTAYLERPSSDPVDVPTPHRAVPPAPEERGGSGGVRVLGRVTVVEPTIAPQLTPRSSTPPVVVPGVPPSPSRRYAAHEPQRAPLLGADQAGALPAAHDAYQDASRRLLAVIMMQLERTPAEQRARLAEHFERSYPRITREPELRALLQRLGLSPQPAHESEVGEWLADIARDVLPPHLKIDRGLTLTRILGLLETLTQSLAEINDAQDTVRQRWLGRQPRESVLRSDNGRAILAYLLNPQANWTERLTELEQTIRELVTHELALFKATLEGARLLVDAVSPQAIAEAEGIELESDDDAGRPSGMWDRWRGGKEATEVRLWRRFLQTHSALVDNERYQRVFLGRVFAKTYLAAMGKPETKR